MQSKDLGSPINAATECFADTDQKLLNYRLGMPFNAGRSERAKLVRRFQSSNHIVAIETA
jgi:hypothetical protein